MKAPGYSCIWIPFSNVEQNFENLAGAFICNRGGTDVVDLLLLKATSFCITLLEDADDLGS